MEDNNSLKMIEIYLAFQIFIENLNRYINENFNKFKNLKIFNKNNNKIVPIQ
jgi:hypothetical protein